MKKVNALIIIFGLILAAGFYAFMMYGLYEFNGLRIGEGDDNERDEKFQFIPVGNETQTGNETLRNIGRSIGRILWETKAIDIIVLGIMLMVASEAAATIVKGIEGYSDEFRAELCETDKFVILREKEEAAKKKSKKE